MSRPRLIALLLALTALVIYLPATHFDFVNYDDEDYVTKNTVVQKGLTFFGIQWAFTTVLANNWHPLTWISHMTDCELFGLNAGGHHLVNILFHAVNSVLLFTLLWRLTGAMWPAAFIAALFAWHPLHVESVAWIAERKDVLSTFFALLALLSYTRYVKENRRSSLWVGLIFFALGLMAKPMLVTLPFVMLLLDHWPLQRFPNFQIQTIRGLMLEKWPFFLLATLSCMITYKAQAQILNGSSAIASLKVVPLHYRLKNIPVAYVEYLLKLAWPAKLAVLYPLADVIPVAHAVIATTTLLLISLTVWYAHRLRPYLLVGWLWFLGTLIPVIGLIQVGGQAFADRYTYIPAIGIFIIATFGARDLASRFQISRVVVVVIAATILAACLAVTDNQLRYWRNSETLFRHALAVTKDNYIAHLNLGGALELDGKFDEAIAEDHAAEKIEPNRSEIHNNLGNCLDGLGKPDKALIEYQKAIFLNPNTAFLHNNAGIVLAKLGRFHEALTEFTNAIQLDPANAAPHVRMGDTLLKQGLDAEAIVQFKNALKLDPLNFKTLAHTAYILSAIENPTVRDGKTALILAIKANVLAGGSQPVVFDILGMAFAENGNFTNAQICALNAFDLATAAKMKNLEPIQQRLELYKNHQPWRESFLATNAPPQVPPKN